MEHKSLWNIFSKKSETAVHEPNVKATRKQEDKDYGEEFSEYGSNGSHISPTTQKTWRYQPTENKMKVMKKIILPNWGDQSELL